MEVPALTFIHRNFVDNKIRDMGVHYAFSRAAWGVYVTPELPTGTTSGTLKPCTIQFITPSPVYFFFYWPVTGNVPHKK